MWIFLGGALLAFLIPKREEIVLGKPQLRWRPIAAILLVVPYILWAAFRVRGYGDTGMYIESFHRFPSTLSSIPSYLATVSKDKGYPVFAIIFKSIFGDRYVLFFLFVAAIQLVIIAFVYRKYSEDYWFSIFVFVAITDYMSWMHNGMRQFIAVTIIFAATPLILKKKYIWALLLVLLAATFHLSALLVIPIFVIVQGKAWNWRTWALLIGAFLVLFFVDRFTGFLDSLLAETQYSNVVSDWTEWEDNGTNPIRVLIYSVPTILSLIGLKYVREEGDDLINMCVGLSVSSTVLYLVSMVTSGIYIGRLPIYMSLYATGILLPWMINHMFTDSSRRLVKGIAILFFTAFFYYQMHIQWKIM